MSFRFVARNIIRKLKLKTASDVLFARFQKDVSSRFRAEALKSLAALQAPDLETALQASFIDAEKDVRVAALELILDVKLSAETVVGMLKEALEKVEPDEQQAVLINVIPADNVLFQRGGSFWV